MGAQGKIVDVGQRESGLGLRIAELGMVPGELVEVLHLAFGEGPMAVRVRGSTFAMRRDEAALIEVEEGGQG